MATSRPILFSAPMVRAILAGQKTQTRRVISPQPDEVSEVNGRLWPYRFSDVLNDSPRVYAKEPIACPHGQPGDLLWVRETCLISGSDAMYADDDDYDGCWPTKGGKTNIWRITPSIHMPRWASRLTLEITGIKVERVNGISTDDILAEGVRLPPTELFADINTGSKLRVRFERLWDSINGKRAGCSWAANPWTWCLSFKVV